MPSSTPAGACSRSSSASSARDFNLDNYLTEPVVEGAPRLLDVAKASREELARLSELYIEEEIVDAGDETLKRVRKTKLKGYTDLEAAVGLIVRIQGWAKPDKVALTDPTGERPAYLIADHPMTEEEWEKQRASAEGRSK